MTLIEVIVGSVLALLVIGLAMALLVPSMRAFSRGAVRSQMESDVTVAMARLTADLQSGSPQGIAFLTDATNVDPQTILAIQPMGRPDAAGTLQWVPQITVYSWRKSRGRILRAVWTTLPGGLTLQADTPTRLTVAQLPSVADGKSPICIAQDVIDFRVDANLPSDRGISDPLSLTLTVQRAGSHQSTPETWTAERSVSLRNP